MIVTWSACASALNTRPVVSSNPMSIGSALVAISPSTSCVSRSTTETKSLREHATNARRRAESIAMPSGSRPTAISAACRQGVRASIRHAAPTGKAASSIDLSIPVLPEARIRTNYDRTMTNILICADSIRSADMRHAVPLAVPDPFIYAEADGVSRVFSNSMEAARLRELGLFEVSISEEFGIDELIGQGLPSKELRAQLAVREIGSLGTKKFSVPESFPLWLADRLRAEGFELEVDQDLFDDRRRSKTDAQIAGMRRAQVA